jgi:hypothetical protein
VALAFVLDENLRGLLWLAACHHNQLGVDVIDVVRVGDPPDLPLGSPDPDILIWAEQNQRILISHDLNTMPGHLAAHLHAGRYSPGVFLLRPNSSLPQVVALLALVAHQSAAVDWENRCEFIP